jgi:hypothetical protein
MYILYSQFNGNLAVIIPCGNINDAIKDVPNEAEYKIVESIEIDNDFFNAYEFSKDIGAVINISKAKEIQLNKFRVARTPLLEKLDISFMQAVEAGNITLQQEISAQKQALRDITNMQLPDTLSELKAVWPKILL